MTQVDTVKSGTGENIKVNSRRNVEIRGVDMLEYIDLVARSGELENLKRHLSESKTIVKTTARNANLMKTFVAERKGLREGPLKEILNTEASYQWPHIAKKYPWP